jgi:hypothetical protein
MECTDTLIMGAFPSMGMPCAELSLLLGLLGISSALIFWVQVTK